MKFGLLIFFVFSFEVVLAKKQCRQIIAEGNVQNEKGKKYFLINAGSESELRFELKSGSFSSYPFYQLKFQIYRNCLMRDCLVDQVQILKSYSDIDYETKAFNLYDLDRGDDSTCKK